MATNDPAQLPHIPFRKLEVERPRRKRQGRGSPPHRQNEEYAPPLLQALALIRETHRHQVEMTPPEFDPALIFKVRTEGTVDEDSWRQSQLTLLSDDPDGVVVLFSRDQLAQFSQRITNYGEPIPEGQRNPRYSWVAAVTTDMALWGRDDRRGRKLGSIDIVQETMYFLDVEIWQVGTPEEVSERMRSLARYIEGTGGRFLDSYLGGSLSIARVSVPGKIIEDLLEVGIVKSVDLPPEPDFTIGPLIHTPIDDLPAPVAPPSDDAPRLCVVDSGLSPTHPLLGPAVADYEAVPARLGDGLDQHGHGTMTSGIVLYGDVKRCIDNLDFSPMLRLFGARVTNAYNKFDDERLIVNQMSEAIIRFATDHQCRVFNVSLGDPMLVFSGGKPSPWAQILDTLARDLDVLIVVSAGNIPLPRLPADEIEELATSYPRFLLSSENAIIEPATAANVLTVGSLAHSESSAFAARFERDPAIRCLAPIDSPSPFTRHGPGVNGAIKPDLVDYGGNWTWDGRAGRILEQDLGVSVVSMHHRHIERLFSANVGTSFAAARVTHLAGQVLAEYPGLSANTLRALIANSCRIPVNAANGLTEDELLTLCGYGQPNRDLAIYSTQNAVTMFSEDQLPLDAFHMYEIPLSDEFKQSSGRRTITVTLAFSPPVRHTRKDYIGAKMAFRLFRGLAPDRLVEWYAAQEGEVDIEKIEARFHCPMTPSPRRREAGTLQRAVFHVAQSRALQAYPGDSLLLLVQCNSKWSTPEELPLQTYSLVVNVAHLDEPINLYNVIRQRARVQRRVRVPA